MSRIAILVTGPNSSGKTTAADRAYEPWKDDDRVLLIRADNDWNKYTAPEMEQRLTQEWCGPGVVLIIEGTNRIANTVAKVWKADTGRVLHVHITRLKPDVMKATLQARCAKTGKEFNAKYWDRSKLEYEGMKRYPNLARKSSWQGVAYYDMDVDYIEQARLIETIRWNIGAALQ
jgi:hypothetical protein